jgi:hypothetical protein
MSKWVRTGNDTGVEKVTLVIKREADPDIYDWLQTIPYGKTNAYIKAALRAAMQGGAFVPPESAAPKKAPVIPKVAVPAHPEPQAVPSSGAVLPSSVPQQNAPQVGGEALEIDPQTLALMREMEGRF